MKTLHNIPSLAVALLAASALTFSACSDEWDKHFDGDDWQTASGQPSLYELIKADGQLSEFLRVLNHTGYDKVLASPQALTVWAPQLTKAQADSVIALYDEQKISLITMPDGSVRYIQDKDNKAITQFVQNHIALYGRSVSSLSNDSIRMMNGKYMMLTQKTLNGVAFEGAGKVANNGILYKLQGKETFAPNVREYLSLMPGLDSVAAYFDLYDLYDLDEETSIQRAIIDGKIVYADSVLTRSNRLYNYLGWINREDSSYLFVAPSNEVWRREYAQFLPYFAYSYSSPQERVQNDSVSRLNAQFAIVRGRLFNIKEQKNYTTRDSLFNTRHVNYNSYYGLNVFDEPFASGGLLAGLTPWNCSNGQLMIDAEGRVNPALTFMESRYILASQRGSMKVAQLLINDVAQPVVTATTRSVADSVRFNGRLFDFKQLKDKNFLELRPITYTGTPNNNSSVYFYLQNTLSNVYYNVYAVMVPAFASADGYQPGDTIPTSFQVFYNERLQQPRTSTDKTDPDDEAAFGKNGAGEVRLSLPEGETHGSRNSFETTGTDIDVICIDKARKPAISGYNFFSNGNNASMRYRLTTNVRTTSLNRGEQTNVLRINRLIYIPFATEKEAKAFELDLSNLKEYNISE